MTSTLHNKKYLGLGRKSVESVVAVPTEGKLITLCGKQ
jgi:hypothetical protein